jgi:hypothetical protein
MDEHTHAVLADLMIKKFYNAIYFSSSRKFVQKHTLSSIYSELLLQINVNLKLFKSPPSPQRKQNTFWYIKKYIIRWMDENFFPPEIQVP